ncbi:MAG: hypothetical protein HFACDABA_02519 [Anaerolineales bacterium]|nr:hypothetical protein [Anaerolineales bacterium]
MSQETFFLKKLEEFIGREAILNDVRGWLQDDKFHPAFFSGEYGIGKTRLLQQILELAKEELKYDGAPARSIDLYHFRHHSPEGLANAIFKCFEDTENKIFFNSFITAHQKLGEARASGDSQAIHEWLQKLLNSCAEGVEKMSAGRGVLLLFDTAEQFVYPTGKRFAPAWEWLKGWIGDLPRGAVFFAGRPAASAFLNRLTLPTIPLDSFTLEETRNYILKAGENWMKMENSATFEIYENEIPILHTLSQGRPILLAIFLEMRMQSNPKEFQDLSGIESKSFEEKIVNYLRNEFGETLNAAGRTSKGINAELLARIRDDSHPNVQDAQDALRNLKDRVFVREFTDDDRVFLHDELYRLLKEYIYDNETTTSAADKQSAAQAIYEYYKEAIKQKDSELQDVFASLMQEDSEQTSFSEEYVEKIREIETSRQRLRTEFVYYRLRSPVKKEGKRKWFEDDPSLEGLKMYYRYGHEAATSNNDEILIPLQIELTNFGLNLEAGNFWKPFIEGLLLIHEVWLKQATGQSYLEDIPNLKNNLEGIANLQSEQKIILQNLLEVWLGTGLVFIQKQKPEYDRAESIFTRVISELENLSADRRLKWFIDVAISLAYRQRAFERSKRGLFQNAIEDYRSGLQYSRFTNFLHEESTLRNDLGFSQQYIGDFTHALENLLDGLQLRYRTAVGPRIALSHSSLAQFYIAYGAYKDAQEHALSTIRISKFSERVGYWRGRVFGYLALAEATRRLAFSFQDVPTQVKYLLTAQKAIEISVQHAEKLTEESKINSKLEEACLYRDFTRVETELSKKKTWFDKSAALLWEVAQRAEEAGINYRLVDAMCNRVWLGYFSNSEGFATQAVNEFKKLEVLAPYWLTNGKYNDKEIAEADPILWSHIGKYCMACGVMSLDTWTETKDDVALSQAARYFMLSLMYSEEFAKDHRGLREGRHRIRQAIAKMDSDELQKFCRFVLNVEETERIPERPSALQRLLRDHALWVDN